MIAVTSKKNNNLGNVAALDNRCAREWKSAANTTIQLQCPSNKYNYLLDIWRRLCSAGFSKLAVHTHTCNKPNAFNSLTHTPNRLSDVRWCPRGMMALAFGPVSVCIIVMYEHIVILIIICVRGAVLLLLQV